MNLPALYNLKFIDSIKNTKRPFLDTQGYGLTINPVDDPSQPHWRVIGIHHLTGAESHGQHNLFVDILDEHGERINNSQVVVRNYDLPPATLTLDKPANEPGTNTQMYFNDTLSIVVKWDGLPSELAEGFHTRHEDDDPPGSTRGHHSYYIVFQKSVGVTEHPPVTPKPPLTPPDASELEAELLATGQPLIQDLNREAALFKAAQAHGLGQRLTGEYELMHEGQTYVAQIFELGLVYAQVGQWDQVKVVDTSAREVTAFGPTLLWDNHITGFFGNRSQYWEWHLKGTVPNLGWIDFKDEVVNQNPVLREDGWVFKANKVYKMPRSADQPAAPAHAPITMPAMPPEPKPPTDPQLPKSIFAQARNGHFYLNDQPGRFMGVNIRGLVHYGQDPHYFQHAPVDHRTIQLQGAKDMNVRLVRVFLAHKDATPQEIERRLRDTLTLMKANFPDMYLLPALTNLYKDVPFYVQGDEKFYESQSPGGKEILNHTFYRSGYEENYLPFVRHIVTAFKDEPQIFAWEIGNELKAENAPELLVNFMTSVAAKIKAWDPNHMVTTGMISTRHAFMEGQTQLRDKLYGSNQIDFVTIHPYNGNEPPHPVENDSDLARKFKKPLIVEEAGFDRNHYSNRPEKTRGDLAFWFGEGASCYMPWGFVKTPHDNNDGDLNVGMTGPLHGDFNQLYELHRQCGQLLGTADIIADVRSIIAQLGLAARDAAPAPFGPSVVDGFDFPVGKPNAGGYYVAAGLVDPAYHANLGYWHSGEDWNGVRGQDTDLGDPVFAVAHGLVTTAYFFPTWGNIVLIEHILPTGEKLWSQYAHLKERLVEKGDIVRRGDLIGTIGKGADDRYIAHLHFEIRRHNLPASKWWKNTPDDRAQILRAYAHPTNFINNFRPR
ncbi:MAG: peptidoglycan DD-metalloendopeptidase family protein [Anaerolineae bacterium]|nr:peptidoglycan DD-metalloendopeptidase family protein [Anaerolineae bacterium]